MASETGKTPTDLEGDLIENASDYDYFQAVRLLTRLISSQRGHEDRKLDGEALKIQPELTLDHAESEVSNIQKIEGGKGYAITTSFMGLYGISSPLPAYYTEDLLDEEWDEKSAARDFFDIIHHHLYPLLYRAWLKYRFSLNAIERNDPDYWDLLFSLFGLGMEEFRNEALKPYELLPYLGLLTQQPKSLLALETLLKDYLKTHDISIIPCVERNVKIPMDQQISLGTVQSNLGQNTVLGSEVADRMGKFSIRIGPMDAETFHRYQRDNVFSQFLRFIIHFYLNQPLEVEIALLIDEHQVQGIRLGVEDWTCLGEDTWLYENGNDKQVTVRLVL